MNGLTRQECSELLEHAVGIRSYSGEEKELAHFLVGWAREHGFERAYVDAVGNAVAEIGPATATRTLVLLGHMDTVPGDIPVRIEDEKLYGRGTVDAKGPLCTFFCAATRVNILSDVRLVVVGAVEEESATSRGARHIRDRFLQEGVPEGCIIGEPSTWDRITLGYKGRLLVDFTAIEASTHTAGPGAFGVADKACRWWSELKSICTRYNKGKVKAFDKILPSLRNMWTESDGLYNTVHAHVGLRLPLHIDVNTLERDIQSLAEEVGGHVQFRGYEPAFMADKRSSLVRAFTIAIRAIGGKPGFKVKTGTSDMNVVGPAWGCPIVAYGPGDSSLDHTPDEHISLEEYWKAIEVLTLVLERWAHTSYAR